jgi:hypothetical protein
MEANVDGLDVIPHNWYRQDSRKITLAHVASMLRGDSGKNLRPLKMLGNSCNMTRHNSAVLAVKNAP